MTIYQNSRRKNPVYMLGFELGLGVSVLDHPLASGHRGNLTLTHRVIVG